MCLCVPVCAHVGAVNHGQHFLTCSHRDATERGRWITLVYIRLHHCTASYFSVLHTSVYSSPHRDATEGGRWLTLVYISLHHCIASYSNALPIYVYSSPHRDATERGRWLTLVNISLQHCNASYSSVLHIYIYICLLFSSSGCYSERSVAYSSV